MLKRIFVETVNSLVNNVQVLQYHALNVSMVLLKVMEIPVSEQMYVNQVNIILENLAKIVHKNVLLV